MKALRLCLVALAATPAIAQDTAFGRSIEMPAHRALFDVLETDPGLAPFTTDGCSGGLSQSWTFVADWFPEFADIHQEKPPWESCCVIHDRAYHNVGGADDPVGSYDARLTADIALQTCVNTTGTNRQSEIMAQYDVSADQVATAYEAIAGAMFLAVRFGGGPCSGLPWRWGYGYSQCSVFTIPTKTD